MPEWVVIVAEVSLLVAVSCSAIIVLDELAGNPQKMWIMNVVWPITALYSGPLGLWAYYRVGRLSTKPAVRAAKRAGVEPPPHKQKPFWQITGLGASHCGAGCTLGDICAEWFVLFVPIVVLGHGIFGAWILDYALAFSFGIAFQYFTIAPMRGLSLGKGLVQAVKADTLSLSAWQLGMYGWMAIATFAVFGHELPKTEPVFWFMMQIAMLFGFMTSFPVNWWLIRKGVKEAM